MASYVYECENGHRHEVIRRMADRDKPYRCEVCDTMAERVMAPASIKPDGAYSYKAGT